MKKNKIEYDEKGHLYYPTVLELKTILPSFTKEITGKALISGWVSFSGNDMYNTIVTDLVVQEDRVVIQQISTDKEAKLPEPSYEWQEHKEKIESLQPLTLKEFHDKIMQLDDVYNDSFITVESLISLSHAEEFERLPEDVIETFDEVLTVRGVLSRIWSVDEAKGIHQCFGVFGFDTPLEMTTDDVKTSIKNKVKQQKVIQYISDIPNKHVMIMQDFLSKFF
jgi:DNA-directed RNA polymerase subunit F